MQFVQELESPILQRDFILPSEVSLWDCSQCSQTSCENLAPALRHFGAGRRLLSFGLPTRAWVKHRLLCLEPPPPLLLSSAQGSHPDCRKLGTAPETTCGRRAGRLCHLAVTGQRASGPSFTQMTSGSCTRTTDEERYE